MTDKLWIAYGNMNTEHQLVRRTPIERLYVHIREGENIRACAKSFQNKEPLYHYIMNTKGDVEISCSHAYYIKEQNVPIFECSRRVHVAVLVPAWMEDWATDYVARFLALLCWKLGIEHLKVFGDETYRKGVHRLEERVKDLLRDKDYLNRWSKECSVL